MTPDEMRIAVERGIAYASLADSNLKAARVLERDTTGPRAQSYIDRHIQLAEEYIDLAIKFLQGKAE